jgi:hypothetical protein
MSRKFSEQRLCGGGFQRAVVFQKRSHRGRTFVGAIKSLPARSMVQLTRDCLRGGLFKSGFSSSTFR